jgi:uncharacterized protein YqhQ
MSDAAAPGHFYGGQAVVEGVMMRGAKVWAVAVRRPAGDIYLERHRVSDFPERHPLFKKPMLRGMYALVDALTIGTKALTISAANSVDEDEEELSSGAIGGSLAMALLLFIGVFVVAPNVGLSFFRGVIGDGWLYHLVEGIVRIGIFLGYLFLISLFGDIKRVFAYHGGEHKTIAAWEHGEPLEPARVQRHSTLHVRCGTNFLIMVMLIALIVYSLAGFVVPAPDGGAVVAVAYHVALRILLLPVVAGLAYEGLRLGAGRENLLVRALMRPGIWLQMITTKPPTDDQVEVAIRAFEAVVPDAELESRGAARVDGALPSKVTWGPDEAGPDATSGSGGGGDVSGPADVTGAPVTGASGGRQTAADEEPTGGS